MQIIAGIGLLVLLMVTFAPYMGSEICMICGVGIGIMLLFGILIYLECRLEELEYDDYDEESE